MTRAIHKHNVFQTNKDLDLNNEGIKTCINYASFDDRLKKKIDYFLTRKESESSLAYRAMKLGSIKAVGKTNIFTLTDFFNPNKYEGETNTERYLNDLNEEPENGVSGVTETNDDVSGVTKTASGSYMII